MPVTRQQSKNDQTSEPGIGKDAQNGVVGGLKGGSRASTDRPAKTGNIQTYTVPFNDKQIPCERHGGKDGQKPSLIFTHGAGGGIENPATQDFALGFAEVAPVVLFQGTMNLPNRIKTYNSVIENEGWGAALGGRSMGARAAGTIAAEREETKAVVLISYPLIGKNDDLRDEILLNLPERVDVLFVIGSKDSMCPSDKFEEVRAKMTARSWLAVAGGADHSMSIKEKAGVQDYRKKTGAIAAEWIAQRDAGKRFCSISWDSDAGQAVSSAWQESDPRQSEVDEADVPHTKKRKKTEE